MWMSWLTAESEWLIWMFFLSAQPRYHGSSPQSQGGSARIQDILLCYKTVDAWNDRFKKNIWFGVWKKKSVSTSVLCSCLLLVTDRFSICLVILHSVSSVFHSLPLYLQKSSTLWPQYALTPPPPTSTLQLCVWLIDSKCVLSCFSSFLSREGESY